MHLVKTFFTLSQQQKQRKWITMSTKQPTPVYSDVVNARNKKINNNLTVSLSKDKSNESIKPKIFLKKANLETKLIPYNSLGELHGLVRHFAPAAQEWRNSIYSYNKNYNKTLTTADNTLITLLKSYLNLKFKRTQKRKKLKKAILAGIRLKKYRGRNKGRYKNIKKRLSVNRIFVSKGNIKHTSSKAIITIFVYKKSDNIIWLKNIKRLFYLMFKSKLGEKRIPRLWDKDLKYKYRKSHRRAYFRYLRKQNILLYLTINKILNKNESFLIYLKNLLTKDKIKPQFLAKKVIANKISYYENKGSIKASSEYKARYYQTMAFKYNRFLKVFKLNELKFKKSFLENFRKLASKMYNKDVTLNFVKLKKYYLNSNIFSQIIALKLKRREFGLSRILSKSLNSIKLPHLPLKKKVNVLKKKLRVNVLYHKNIFDLLKAKQKKRAKNFWFELLLFKYYRAVNPFSLFGRMKLVHRKIQNIILRSRHQSINKKKWSEKKEMKKLLKVFYLKAKFIKNKVLAGIRVEAKGRLTRRFKASRSVYKLKWIGGLRNIDSSYKGLSASMLRGHDLSNVERTSLSSKRRIGAYGVKGWVSSL